MKVRFLTRKLTIRDLTNYDSQRNQPFTRNQFFGYPVINYNLEEPFEIFSESLLHKRLNKPSFDNEEIRKRELQKNPWKKIANVIISKECDVKRFVGQVKDLWKKEEKLQKFPF